MQARSTIKTSSMSSGCVHLEPSTDERSTQRGRCGRSARGRRCITYRSAARALDHDLGGGQAANYAKAWLITARRAAVIWSPILGVLAVRAAGVLCAFCWVLDTLPGQCLRRRLRANPLVADAFRTKRLLR